jgi:hypothetical protein
VLRLLVVDSWTHQVVPAKYPHRTLDEYMLDIGKAVELLKRLVNIDQPINIPLPPPVKFQISRRYMLVYDEENEMFGIIGIKSMEFPFLQTGWYAVFDLTNNKVLKYKYWHPEIVNTLLSALKPLTK